MNYRFTYWWRWWQIKAIVISCRNSLLSYWEVRRGVSQWHVDTRCSPPWSKMSFILDCSPICVRKGLAFQWKVWFKFSCFQCKANFLHRVGCNFEPVRIISFLLSKDGFHAGGNLKVGNRLKEQNWALFDSQYWMLPDFKLWYKCIFLCFMINRDASIQNRQLTTRYRMKWWTFIEKNDKRCFLGNAWECINPHWGCLSSFITESKAEQITADRWAHSDQKYHSLLV